MAKRKKKSVAAKALYHLSGASVLWGASKATAKITYAPLAPFNPVHSRPGQPGTRRYR